MKFLLLVIVLAVTIYLTVRLIERRGGRGGSFGATLNKRPNRPTRPARPLGPDDDPDFLRDLNRRNRKRDE